MKQCHCAVALGALVLASRAGAAEFGEATRYYEDDAWYDVTEWFDGNDYNPTDEATWRWDDETYELAQDTSGDVDNDLTYGFDGGLDDDWYYDYYDPYAYSYLGDPGADGLYGSATRYYDYDRDGVYDAYAAYADLDGDGAYDDYDYYSFNTAGDEQRQRATRAAAGSSRQTMASGQIRQMKLVDVPGGRQHVVVSIAPRSGQGTQGILADLGERSQLEGAQLGLGKTISVTGPRARIGGKSIVLARSVEVNGTTRRIARDNRTITAKVLSTHRTDVRGTPHLMALVKPTQGGMSGGSSGKIAVDLGPADRLDANVKQGSELTFTAVPVKAGDRLLLMASSVRTKQGMAQIDRRRSADREGKASEQQASKSVVGTVESMQDDTLSLQNELGETHEFSLGDDTRYTRGGRSISKDQIQQGDEVRTAFRGEPGSLRATEVIVMSKGGSSEQKGQQKDQQQRPQGRQ